VFQSRGLNLSFGTLNPGSGVDVLVPVSGVSTAGDCAPGQPMKIDGDDGRNFINGTRNLKSATGVLIPYSLAGLPQSSTGPGNNNYVSFTFNGSILWSAYADASAGSYSDTVIISVTP
jgi:spore coat protein U-like protein